MPRSIGDKQGENDYVKDSRDRVVACAGIHDELVNPQKREPSSDVVKQLSGPGFAGSGIRGGGSRRVSKGDMVVIPADTPHGFTDVQEPITYTIVRIDPNRVLALK